MYRMSSRRNAAPQRRVILASRKRKEEILGKTSLGIASISAYMIFRDMTAAHAAFHFIRLWGEYSVLIGAASHPIRFIIFDTAKNLRQPHYASIYAKCHHYRPARCLCSHCTQHIDDVTRPRPIFWWWQVSDELLPAAARLDISATPRSVRAIAGRYLSYLISAGAGVINIEFI